MGIAICLTPCHQPDDQSFYRHTDCKRFRSCLRTSNRLIGVHVGPVIVVTSSDGSAPLRLVTLQEHVISPSLLNLSGRLQVCSQSSFREHINAWEAREVLNLQRMSTIRAITGIKDTHCSHLRRQVSCALQFYVERSK